MLIKNPPPSYRKAVPPPVRRQPRRGLMPGCLLLFGLLLALVACGFFGVVVSLGWLTPPAETNRITRIQQLPPLAPPSSPVAMPDPAATVASAAEAQPLVALPAGNSAVPVAEATAAPVTPVASTATAEPPPVAAAAETESQPPAELTPAPGAPSNLPDAPAIPVTVAPIPDWWQSYMNRVQEQNSTD